MPEIYCARNMMAGKLIKFGSMKDKTWVFRSVQADQSAA